MKFQVGDRVRTIKDFDRDWPEGTEGTIVQVQMGDSWPYRVDKGGDTALFHESELELVSEVASGVNHPDHYTWLKDGVEVIDITSNFSFVRGNAIKYLMRADHKGKKLEDLKKARWYIDYEISELEKESN